MKSKHYLYALLGMLILCVGFGVIGCGDDDDSGDGGTDTDTDCDAEGDGGMMICAENLDCETNWVREEGQNGRLYQAVEITFNVPEAYTGPENVISTA